MLGAGVGIKPQYRAAVAEELSFPVGFGWVYDVSAYGSK